MYLTKFNKWSKICQVKLSGWTNADSEGKNLIIENVLRKMFKTSVIIWLSYIKLKMQMDHIPNSGD